MHALISNFMIFFYLRPCAVMDIRNNRRYVPLEIHGTGQLVASDGMVMRANRGLARPFELPILLPCQISENKQFLNKLDKSELRYDDKASRHPRASRKTRRLM